ncbi:MAG: ExbD/TolR family protein [Planctomycetota bacterium]|jgi:biopolymer transport protein ExbD
MSRRRRKKKARDEKVTQPPLTPFIDVIFQMLIYFMLTMHFKELEGKLLSQLPRKKGLEPQPDVHPPLNDVRIFLCTEPSAIREHMNNKGRHEQRRKDGSVCTAFVELTELGALHKTERRPAMRAPNRRLYRLIGEKTREIWEITPDYWDENRRPPVILDADSEVPYEHVIGVLNACKEAGVPELEFVGNPRFGEFYGSGEKSQFKMEGE